LSSEWSTLGVTISGSSPPSAVVGVVNPLSVRALSESWKSDDEASEVVPSESGLGSMTVTTFGSAEGFFCGGSDMVSCGEMVPSTVGREGATSGACSFQSYAVIDVGIVACTGIGDLVLVTSSNMKVDGSFSGDREAAGVSAPGIVCNGGSTIRLVNHG
jgi:hypothetical protein